jgi:competence ComEA-like helix-hairpin-helix protein
MADPIRCAGLTSLDPLPAAVCDPPGKAGSGPTETASGWLARTCQRYEASLWGPVVLKAGGFGLLLLALAGVGRASILASAEGQPQAATRLPLIHQLGSAWLKPAASTHRPAEALSAVPAGSARPPPSGTPVPAVKPSGLTPEGKVILNQAGVEDLMRLPEIGRKRAESILALRARLGRFKRPTDLLRVRGLGPKRLQRLLPHVVVDAPPDPKQESAKK